MRQIFLDGYNYLEYILYFAYRSSFLHEASYFLRNWLISVLELQFSDYVAVTPVLCILTIMLSCS